MLARSSSFSANNLGYHQGFVLDLHKIFKWYFFFFFICHQKKCVLLSTSHSHCLSILGIFHNVTTHVNNCYDSVLKFITLAKSAELSVHFKLFTFNTMFSTCRFKLPLDKIHVLMMTVVTLPGPGLA